MERVTSIGGLFIKSDQPEKLGEWYKTNLGIPINDGTAEFHSRDLDSPNEERRTVFSIFERSSDYFGPGGKSFMMNFRVEDLDRMVGQLRRGGVVIEKTEEHEYGKFAWVTDPDGNRIELWEPKG